MVFVKLKKKVEAIINAPLSINVTQVKALLDLVSSYSRLVLNLSAIVHLLNQWFKKNVQFKWYVECECAFDAIENEITSDSNGCFSLWHFDSAHNVR